ncbi:alpha/beta hydrolase [Acetobacteraceae bacterium H6797]|nr:alpha/beta hydrolase [Acetobacteraceae bacterium H6797]
MSDLPLDEAIDGEPLRLNGEEMLAWKPAASRAQSRPPVLLLHGAACGGWIWQYGFGAALARAGYPTYAVTFRRDDNAGLADFTEQARAALLALGEPAIVLGHSLGGLIAQRLLSEARLKAAGLLAPVSPEGLWWSAARLAVAEPGLWQAVSHMTDPPGKAGASIGDALFGPDMDRDALPGILARLGGESSRALMEAQSPQAVSPAWMMGKPMLIMGATADRLIPADSIARCGAWHGVTPMLLPGCGHLLMLDQGWEKVAQRVIGWMDRLG